MTSTTSSSVNKPKIELKNDGFQKWMKTIYDPNFVSDDALMELYDAFKYQGFDREDTLKKFFEKVPDPGTAIQLIIVCALRGPKRASETKLLNNISATQMGIPASGMKGTKGLSCARITACTADLAAFHLKRIGVPKRLMMDCPAWLQFPSAGSIKMPQKYRDQHLEFTKKFSNAINGEFIDQIYTQMEANAYLSEGLKLFD
jgi:hypothetical protein